MRTRWLDVSSQADWSALLARVPADRRDIYHSPEYVRLYEGPDSRAVCFAAEDGDQVFLHPILESGIPGHPGLRDAMTAYGYGGPVSSSDDADFLTAAGESFRAEARARGIVAELVKFHPLLENHARLRPALPRDPIPACQTVYVELQQDEARRWEAAYSHANRKTINKAKRNGVEIRFGHEPEAWSAFFSLYAETMEANRAGEFYRFSPEYFAQLRERLADRHVLAYATAGSRIVSVLIVLLGPGLVHCHLLGTLREAMNLGANNLLHHELILWAKARGDRLLHIGGGRNNDEDDPLLRFKKSFSDRVATFHVGEHVLDPEAYRALCEEWERKNPDRQVGNRLLKYRL